MPALYCMAQQASCGLPKHCAAIIFQPSARQSALHASLPSIYSETLYLQHHWECQADWHAWSLAVRTSLTVCMSFPKFANLPLRQQRLIIKIWYRHLQEVAAQAEQALAALKVERRKLQAAEKQLKAAAESRAEAIAAAAASSEELVVSRAELERFKRLSEDRAGLVVQAENAAVETSQQCDAQVS